MEVKIVLQNQAIVQQDCILPKTCPYYGVCHNTQQKCNVEKVKVDPSITPHTKTEKNNSKWIIDLNL